MEIRNTIITAAVALLVGSLVSWHFFDEYRTTHELKAVVNTLEASRVQVQEDLKRSDIDDEALHTRMMSLQSRLAQFQLDAKQYVPSKQPPPPSGASSSASLPVLVLRHDLLTSGTVCVLNAARNGVPSADRSCDSDGAGSTASAVEAEDLIDNDLEVTTRYWQLKSKYDVLRDTVEKFQKRTELKK